MPGITFHLRPEAKFHDGSPVAPDDVLFSFRTLKQWGHPRCKLAYDMVKSAAVTGKRTIRFALNTSDNCTQLFTLAELPILSKQALEKQSANPPLKTNPLVPLLNSGPYRIGSTIPGKELIFERVHDYWGRDLLINQGKFNFDRIIIDFYRDLNVAFEHFKSGALDAHIETVARNRETAYRFPAIKTGEIKQIEIPLFSPGGLRTFVFNTRRPPFNKEQSRATVSLMFDFSLINRLLFHDSYHRNQSIFPFLQNQLWTMSNQNQLALLHPFRKQFPPAVFLPSPLLITALHPGIDMRRNVRLSSGWSRLALSKPSNSQQQRDAHAF